MNLSSGTERRLFLLQFSRLSSLGISAKSISLIMGKKIRLPWNLWPWLWGKDRFLAFWGPMELAKLHLFLFWQECTPKLQERLGSEGNKSAMHQPTKWLESVPSSISFGLLSPLKSIYDFTANWSKFKTSWSIKELKNLSKKSICKNKEIFMWVSCQEECKGEYQLPVPCLVARVSWFWMSPLQVLTPITEDKYGGSYKVFCFLYRM